MIKKRLFIGVPLPDNVKRKIKKYSENFKQILKANFVQEENYHITLKFLGYCNNEKKIIENLNNITFEAFNVIVQDLGVFPNERVPRILWVGANNFNKFMNLHNVINENLKQLNFEENKKFHPHITIARIKFVKNKEDFKKLIKNKVIFGRIKISSFVLYESVLKPTGPIYKIIKKFSYL